MFIANLLNSVGELAATVADNVRTTGMGTSHLWNAATGSLSANTAEVQPFANQTAPTATGITKFVPDVTGITKFVPDVTGITKFVPPTPETVSAAQGAEVFSVGTSTANNTVSTVLDTALSYAPAMPSMPSFDNVTSHLPSSSDMTEHATLQTAAIAGSVVAGGLLLNQMRQNGVRSTIAKGKSLLPSFGRSQEQSQKQQFDAAFTALIAPLSDAGKNVVMQWIAGGYNDKDGKYVNLVEKLNRELSVLEKVEVKKPSDEFTTAITAKKASLDNLKAFRAAYESGDIKGVTPAIEKKLRAEARQKARLAS